MGADEEEKADSGEERGSTQGLLHQLVLQLSMTQLALVTSGDHFSAPFVSMKSETAGWG